MMGLWRKYFPKKYHIYTAVFTDGKKISVRSRGFLSKKINGQRLNMLREGDYGERDPDLDGTLLVNLFYWGYMTPEEAHGEE